VTVLVAVKITVVVAKEVVRTKLVVAGASMVDVTSATSVSVLVVVMKVLLVSVGASTVDVVVVVSVKMLVVKVARVLVGASIVSSVKRRWLMSLSELMPG
jgi:hypothetical protein